MAGSLRQASLAGLSAVGVGVAAPALAFDCAQAKSKVERAICGEPAAKAADDAMSAAFDKLRGTLSGAELTALVRNQRAWLKMRDLRCQSDSALASCLRERNLVRARALSAEPDSGPGTPNPLTPVIVDRPGGKSTYAVNLFLFRFAAPKTPAENLLNGKVRKIVAEAPTKTGDPASATPYEWERKARIAYASDRLLSIRIDGYEMSGGAHPNPSVATINIDMKSGRELSIGDLVDGANRNAIVSMCEEQVGRQLREKIKEGGDDPDGPEGKAMLQDLAGDAKKGVAETLGDLANWTFGGSSVELTFMPYSVAPYALGAFTCTISYGELRRLAKPAFPLP